MKSWTVAIRKREGMKFVGGITRLYVILFYGAYLCSMSTKKALGASGCLSSADRVFNLENFKGTVFFADYWPCPLFALNVFGIVCSESHTSKGRLGCKTLVEWISYQIFLFIGRNETLSFLSSIEAS